MRDYRYNNQKQKQKITREWGPWLDHSVGHVTLDLGVELDSTLGGEIT